MPWVAIDMLRVAGALALLLPLAWAWSQCGAGCAVWVSSVSFGLLYGVQDCAGMCDMRGSCSCGDELGYACIVLLAASDAALARRLAGCAGC